jgi:uncharacterized protein (DUF433 family)
MPEFPRITRDPNVMNGRPCLRDTHVAVTTVLSLLSTGRTEIEIVRRFPSLSIDDIHEALLFAAWEVDPSEMARSAMTEAAKPALPAPPRYLQPPKPKPVEPAPSEVAPTPPREQEPNLEYFHPSRPDQPTVMLTSHGIIDRRWSTGIIAWCDIRDIRRIPGEKTIVISLRNPKTYLASLPFFEWIVARIRLFINLRALYLDTASLGVRTQDLLTSATRFWTRNRGAGRKKRRIRIGRSKRKKSLFADEYLAE